MQHSDPKSQAQYELSMEEYRRKVAEEKARILAERNKGFFKKLFAKVPFKIVRK